jgi:hypothetical protein
MLQEISCSNKTLSLPKQRHEARRRLEMLLALLVRCLASFRLLLAAAWLIAWRAIRTDGEAKNECQMISAPRYEESIDSFDTAFTSRFN